MAVSGDVFDAVPEAIANNGTKNIQPASGHEAVIHNIYTGMGACELYKFDNTTLSKIDSASGWLGYAFHVTNTCYLQVKNVSGGSLNISFDGIYTKPATE
jgi:hypothetical protein